MKNDKLTELIWTGKYDRADLEGKAPVERLSAPFQTVETVNEPRLKGGLNMSFPDEEEQAPTYPRDWKNRLIWGDNKLVMSSLLKQGWAGRINLIYIDPPFFTGADFSMKTTVANEEVKKEPSIIEERAYSDIWSGGIASYLKYMYPRLVLMRELLAENGSIYVHLDWHVGHYVKVMMDEIFGFENFRNEIVWVYTRPGLYYQNQFPRVHDIILWYSKSPETWTFNTEDIRIPYDTKTVERGKYSVATSKMTKGIDQRVLDGRGKCPEDWWHIPIPPGNAAEYLHFETQKPEALLKRIIIASSNPGDIVADFFCGSGTTPAVAEKLGRRWLMSDLSKFAIHTTRKRLLNIHNSKELQDNQSKSYGKLARPFEVWNIGSYETSYWREKQDEYLSFMLKLYQAQPLQGFKYIHGRKADRAVHIGPLDAPVAMEDIERVVLECRANKFNKADVLGWDWAYEVNDLGKTLAKKEGIDLRLIQIPSVNELKSSLVGFDLKLLQIPDQVMERELLPHVRFSEVAYLELQSRVNGRQVTLTIADFQLPPSQELSRIAGKIKSPYDLIDYWAIDWDYKGDTFHNGWQSYRTNKNRKLDLEASHNYTDEGEHQIMVKVVDVFGNDTNKVLKIRV